MLRVTADVFSGRSNPAWIITDEREAQATLRAISRDSNATTDTAQAEGGLGFRGLLVESLTDDLTYDADQSTQFYVPVGSSASSSQSNEIAERLIGQITQATADTQVAHDALPLDAALQQFLLDQLISSSRTSGPDSNIAPEATEAAGTEDDAAVTCYIEYAAYNPNFWNNNATILSRNNCYNYASNKRTDTFAQPGRGSGHIYTAITCPAVTAAALSDGLHHRYVCFPTTQAPRYLVALVVAPGPGFIDFHWYRKNTEGFWSHKPGGTKVRNVDNSNVLILNPETCNRGPYTRFCGYFYTCKSQRIN
ncbi:MAG: hypothetical protein SH847_15575 [Roseiflexaceae bacterium]|nr:hypothetical protein [Roseiflexaceae bacterium]